MKSYSQSDFLLARRDFAIEMHKSLSKAICFLCLIACILNFQCQLSVQGVFVDSNGKTFISLGQVTSAGCSNHRNGPKLAVDKINQLNNGKGFAIGFDNSAFVSFNLTSYVISSTITTSSAEYVVEHQRLINKLLVDHRVDMFIGSCSQGSEAERDLIDSAGKLVFAQVGPDQYYIDAQSKNQSNVFGAHLSSYKYTEPFLQLAAGRGAKTVAIAGRLQSLFFETTCSNAKMFAQDLGMQVVYFNQYDHATLKLSSNITYQRDVATEIVNRAPDIVIGCVGGSIAEEVPTWLDIFRQNEFIPAGLWLTSATW